MPDTIRKRICDRWTTLLAPLVTLLGVPPLTWTLDPLQVLQPLPNILLYAGDESELGADIRGRTKQFDIVSKYCFAGPRENNKAGEDAFVKKITELVEGDIQLTGLANIVNQRRVRSFVMPLQTPATLANVVIVTWRVEYRARLAQPDVAY